MLHNLQWVSLFSGHSVDAVNCLLCLVMYFLQNWLIQSYV